MDNVLLWCAFCVITLLGGIKNENTKYQNKVLIIFGVALDGTDTDARIGLACVCRT